MRLVPATIDHKLLFFLLALMGIGLVTVFSATSVTALEHTNDKFHSVKQQLRGMVIGCVGLMAFLALDYRRLKNWAWPMYLLTLGLLSLLFIPGVGVTVNGATRWLNLGFIRIQPSEISKLTMIIFMASSLAQNYRQRDSFRRYLLPNIIALVVMCLFIVMQRSLSVPALIFIVGFLMMLVAYPNLGHILSMASVGLAGVVTLIILEPYRMRRLVGFFDPWADPTGTGYHIIQSLLGLGTGGLTGVGIGQSIQKLDYLPFKHTDFIFSVLGEEMGLIGALVVIFLYVGLFWRGIRIALYAPDHFGMFLAFGITSTIAVQAFINIAVTLGLMPTTGMPLPFISYGRSGLVVTLASMGILLNISAAAERENLSRMSRRLGTL